MKSGKSIIMSAILLFSVIATTIIHSAYNTKLQINGDAMLRVDEEIRITGIEKVEYTNGAYENYNSKYSKDTVSIYATLPANSSITYEMEITNKSEITDYEIDEIKNLSNSNPNVIIESNINIWDEIAKNSKREFTITIINNTEQEQEISLINQYKFVEKTLPILMSFAGGDWGLKTKYRDDEYIGKIKTVTLMDEISEPEGVVASWNLDEADRGKVMGYLVPNQADSSMYDLYIQGAGKVIANPNSSFLFGCLEKTEKINNLNILDTSITADMSNMFRDSGSLISLDVSNFDTSKVTNMLYMFCGTAELKNLNLNNFKTSNVSNMSYMFSGTGLINLDLSSFDTKNVITMQGMFQKATILEKLDVSDFNTEKVTNMNSMFRYCYALKSLDLRSFVPSSVTDMSYMFSGCKVMTTLDFDNFDTSKVISMKCMFYNCSKLESLDLSRYNTKNVTTMYEMFCWCNSLKNLDLSSFDTSKVTNMEEMFAYCMSLTGINVSSFDTRNVTTMRQMFRGCDYLKTIDLSSFITNKVTNMYGMFCDCHRIESIDISNFDTSNVTDMGLMFIYNLQMTDLDLSSFDTSKVTNMEQMFMGSDKLNHIYVGKGWSTKNVTNSTNMFKDCLKLSGKVSYNASKIDASVANYTNGYLTYKV